MEQNRRRRQDLRSLADERSEIVHQKFSEQKAENGAATFTAMNHWTDDTGKPFLTEERTMQVRPAALPAGRLVIRLYRETVGDGRRSEARWRPGTCRHSLSAFGRS